VGVLAGQKENWPFGATRSSLISCNYAGRYNSPRIPQDIPDCYGFQTEESVKIRSIHLIHGESFAGLYLHALQELGRSKKMNPYLTALEPLHKRQYLGNQLFAAALASIVRLDNVDDDFSASVLVL
jgi:hypothetical protein